MPQMITNWCTVNLTKLGNRYSKRSAVVRYDNREVWLTLCDGGLGFRQRLGVPWTLEGHPERQIPTPHQPAEPSAPPGASMLARRHEYIREAVAQTLRQIGVRLPLCVITEPVRLVGSPLSVTSSTPTTTSHHRPNQQQRGPHASRRVQNGPPGASGSVRYGRREKSPFCQGENCFTHVYRVLYQRPRFRLHGGGAAMPDGLIEAVDRGSYEMDLLV